MSIAIASPRLARYGLGLLGLSFITCVLVVVMHNKFGLFGPGEIRVATSGFAILMLPFFVACNHILNNIDAQTSRLSMRPDNRLHDIVRPFIDGLQFDVTVSQYASDEVNAFALSSIVGKKAVIAFSSKMVEVSSAEQLSAFAAHEVAHVKHDDSRNKAFILAFYEVLMVYPALLSEISKKSSMVLVPLFLLMLIISFAAVAHFMGTARAISQLTPMIFVLVRWAVIAALFVLGFVVLKYFLKRSYFAYSRAREFAADATAAEMVSPEVMISALNLLNTSIADVGVFDTHPLLAERIARLSKPYR